MRKDNKINIRSEESSDIDVITELTKAAFENHPPDRQIEHFIILDLRAAGALSISLVSEVDGLIVGHIAFSPVTISDGTTNWYGLGPVSVLPDYQGCKIGMTLVNTGLDLLKSMGAKGCAIAGLPIYFNRFGFTNHPQLIHEEGPQEIFSAKSFIDWVPCGKVEFHQAFKQLSIVEKDAISDVIIDYDFDGVKVDFADPAIESLIEKEILIEMPNGKFRMQPPALAAYDSYFSQIAQFRATEMSRVHKNPILTAIRWGH